MADIREWVQIDRLMPTLKKKMIRPLRKPYPSFSKNPIRIRQKNPDQNKGTYTTQTCTEDNMLIFLDY